MRKNGPLVIIALLSLLSGSAFGRVSDAVYNPYEIGKQAFYANNNISLWTGWGFMRGDVTYRIGGQVVQNGVSTTQPFPISELKWPVNIPLAVIGADGTLGGRCSFYGQFMQNSNSYFAGKMQDSDWLYTTDVPELYLPDYRTIYSESDARVTAIKGEGGIRFWSEDRSHMLAAHPLFGAGVGFLYQSFKWNVSDVDQWYPQDPSAAHVVVGGLVGTYSAVIQVPYAEIISAYQDEGYQFSASLGFSPAAHVSDEDYHLLRSKHSQAEMNGNAIKASAECRYDVMKHVFLMAKADFLSLSADGVDYVNFYGGEYAGAHYTIDHKVRSMTYSAILIAGIKF